MPITFEQLINRYLYPDQILFGHLLNPNIKSPNQYQFSKSSSSLSDPDELIIYEKKMSQTKIQSMINMMQGNHPPLFKSSTASKTHLTQHQDSDGNLSYEEENDYDDYEDEMYLMEKDYDDNFDDQYDDEENPLMAVGKIGNSMAAIKNYAKELNYLKNNNKKEKEKNFMLHKSQHHKFSKGESEVFQTLKSKQNSRTKDISEFKQKSKAKEMKQQQNLSDQDWQTESEEEFNA